MHAVFFGKTFDQIIFMLPYALHEVTGDADVKRTVALAGENVNGGLHDARVFENESRRLLLCQPVFDPQPGHAQKFGIGADQRGIGSQSMRCNQCVVGAYRRSC